MPARPASSSWASVPVSNGLYNVMLGSLVALDVAIFDTARWVGVQAGSDAEMTPRVKLASAPFAIRAQSAATAAAVSGPVAGAVPWVMVSGTSQQAAANTAYIVTGAQTDACVRSTLHGAFTRGYDTTLVADAHTTEDLTEWGAPPVEQVIAHTNLYWSWQTAPGRTAAVVPAAEVELS